MLLFIAMPIVSVVIQSIYAPHPAVLVEVVLEAPGGRRGGPRRGGRRWAGRG